VIGPATHDPASRARALKAEGRLEEALPFLQQAVAAKPSSGVARHNLAATLGDLGRYREALEAADGALARGLDAPETWLVKARAHLGLAELERSEDAFRQAIARRPDYLDAHRDLAQLLWMRTSDAAAAVSALDAAPATAPLTALRARVLEYAGELEGAAAALAPILAGHADQPGPHLQASGLAVALGRPEEALRHAEAAARLAPADRAVRTALCTAYLGMGEVTAASAVAEALLAAQPHDQNALALQATAWRLAGDPRLGALWDERLVGAYTLEAPAGWPDLQAWLQDLKVTLEALHGPLLTHPLEQSLRGGSQTPQNLRAVSDPAVRAFFHAIDAPIRSYLDRIGQGEGPLASRNTGDYRMKGVWSVRLRRGGSHVDHIHSEGWISSAFYVDLPGTLDTPEREGWIRFGRPPFPTRPPIEPFLHVRPEPGRLVLFPSYLWHGTVPFTSDETRLTIAFDLIPG
jgi:tetratricopeptide (TPR) repeat protein